MLAARLFFRGYLVYIGMQHGVQPLPGDFIVLVSGRKARGLVKPETICRPKEKLSMGRSSFDHMLRKIRHGGVVGIIHGSTASYHGSINHRSVGVKELFCLGPQLNPQSLPKRTRVR